MSSFKSADDFPVLSPNLTCHAWNKDRSMIAVSPNSKKIFIFKVKGENLKDWGKPAYILPDHDSTVTSIDWAPESNRILSASHDRNAYVWTFDQPSNQWKPALVLLRINRAATSCKWCKSETKFAVGSGAKLVSVCYFDVENNWWVAKMIKKGIKSTVTTIDWHPTDNTLVAFGSSDKKVRVCDSFIKEADEKKQRKVKFGAVLEEYSTNGWIHAVKFSPSGNTLAISSHDCNLTFVDRSGETPKVEVLRIRDLPYTAICFLSETALVCGGFDFVPFLVSKKSDKWEYCGKIDTGEEKTTLSSTSSAFKKFQDQSKMGEQKSAAIKTRHKNVINAIQSFKASNDVVEKYTTSSLDGQILFWAVKDLKTKFPDAKI